MLRTPSASSRSRPVLAQLIAYIPSIIAATTLVYAAFAAITQLGITVQLTAPTFLMVLGAVALAAAIAFGFGAQGGGARHVEKAYERRDEAKQTVQQQGDPAPGSTTGINLSAPRPQGGTALGAEDKPSARPLRREE